MVSGTEHLADVGAAKLSFVIDFDCGAFRARADLDKSRLFKPAVFIKIVAHGDKHQDENYTYYGYCHEDIRNHDADILNLLFSLSVHCLRFK